MSLVQIQTLKDLSEKDRTSILRRESLDLDDIIKEVIHPLAAAFEKNAHTALREASLRFDKVIPEPMLLTRDHLQQALERVKKSSAKSLEAFSLAMQNIREFHKAQIPTSFDTQIAGNTLGYKFIPFDSAALYVPGGKALYPSTVMMGVIPAQIAGVENILLLSPPEKESGQVSDIVQAVAALSGVTGILQAGGAQAVLAAAYGIPELGISQADFIYGPGNIYVAAAKNFVAQKNLSGIDSFAGPSEVLIISDHRSNPYWLAHDLLAQAEHDENSSAILLVTDRDLAQRTSEMLEKAIESRGTRSHITRAAMQRNGYIFIVDSLQEAVEFSNLYAPEHLEIQTENPLELLPAIKCAGSIFLGDYAPVAAGDYYTGTNHILPTSSAARYASGVSVQSFYRRVTWQHITRQGLQAGAAAIEEMSKVEGLFDEHGWSVLARFEET